MGRSRPGQGSRSLGQPPDSEALQADDPEQTQWVSVGTWGQTIPWDFVPSGDQSGQWGVPAQPLTCFERVHSEEAHGVCAPGHHSIRLGRSPLTGPLPPPPSSLLQTVIVLSLWEAAESEPSLYDSKAPGSWSASITSLATSPTQDGGNRVGAEQTGRELGPTQHPSPTSCNALKAFLDLAAAPANERNE